MEIPSGHQPSLLDLGKKNGSNLDTTNNNLSPVDEIKPRPYQGKAMDILHEGIQEKDILLLQAATGAGKTFIIVRMIQKYYYDHPDRNFLILMHKKELVLQFMDAFKKFTDIIPEDIGICCSSITNKPDLEAPILVATVQSFINRLDVYPGADLVVIDETHRAGYESNESQYQATLERLREYKPNHKTIGVTATAYRLGHGYIFGDGCKPGRTNFFPELTHRITYKELVRDGFLMPLKGFSSVTEEVLTDINGLRKQSGEYVMADAGEVMTQHIDSAVDAYEQYGEDHKHVAVFACTIDHAEMLKQAFMDRGYSAVVIHSKLAKSMREENLRKWHSGEVQFAISVNILIEGFDFPGLSCLIMCRPTKSPVVFIQAIGRILRMHPEKKEALLIDCTGNVKEFGTDLDNPQFPLPKTKDGEMEGSMPEKVCPGENEDGTVCGNVLHIAVLVCPFCGYQFEKDVVNKELGIMEEVNFKEAKPPEWHDVNSMDAFIHDAKNGKKLLRVKIETDTPKSLYYNKEVSIWFCFQDHYSGFAVTAGRERWEKFSWDEYPSTVEEAEFLIPTIQQPFRVKCVEDEKGYLEAIDFDFLPPDLQSQAERKEEPEQMFAGPNFPYPPGADDDVPF